MASDAMQRADELLRRMTIEEKAFQLTAVMPMGLMGSNGPIVSELERQIGHGIGQMSAAGQFGGSSPAHLVRTINSMQRFLIERTRLGIPAIFHNEALNGLMAPQYTVFPTAIGLAATWNADAVQEMATIIRWQMRSVGLRQALAPVMDVARDARWGRVHETYGEDPYLVSAMSVAYTRGLQGQDLREGVLATAKHFLGYAVTEAGQNLAATQVGRRELYEVYARPFEAAMKLAGLASVMNSYAEFDGIPVAASREILTDLLRGRMGFEGTVVSDYFAIAWLKERLSVATTHQEAGTLALAEVLCGHVNPSGKLPYSLPRHSGQIPISVGQKNGSGYRRTAEDMQKGYVDMPATPLFAFGHGLSYTHFAYTHLVLRSHEVPSNGKISVSAQITNTGTIAGDEVVQLSFSDTATGVPRPAQALVGFARVHLEAGASAEVTFAVVMSQLGSIGFDGTFQLEPGPIHVQMGAASDDIRLEDRFEVIGARMELAGKRSYLSSVTVQLV